MAKKLNSDNEDWYITNTYTGKKSKPKVCLILFPNSGDSVEYQLSPTDAVYLASQLLDEAIALQAPLDS